jgi:hypothetical protein
MNKYNLRQIETIMEIQDNEWVYRFFVSYKGVNIMRTQSNPVLWGHGFRTETYSITENKFISNMESGLPEYFNDIDIAIATLNEVI